MAKDKFTWKKSTDPDGGTHWIRERVPSRGSRVAKSFSTVNSALKSALPILLVIILFRWFMMVNLGYGDPDFKAYPDGSGLYYYDVFAFLRRLANGLGLLSNSFDSIINHTNWSDFDVTHFPGNIYNVFVFLLNVGLFIFKLIILFPTMLTALLFGGFLTDWVSPGGWAHELTYFYIPYWDAGAFWSFVGETLSLWASYLGSQLQAFWNSIWGTIQSWFSWFN